MSELFTMIADWWERLPSVRKKVFFFGTVGALIAVVLLLGRSSTAATAAENYRIGLEAKENQDYATAVRRFESVAGLWSAPQRVSAAYHAAHSYEGLGEYAKAAEGYAKFLRDHGDDPIYAPQAAWGLARAREAAGETEAARAAMREALARHGAGPLAGAIRLEAARFALGEGDRARAAEILAPILAVETSDTDPAATFAPLARGLLMSSEDSAGSPLPGR